MSQAHGTCFPFTAHSERKTNLIIYFNLRWKLVVVQLSCAESWSEWLVYGCLGLGLSQPVIPNYFGERMWQWLQAPPCSHVTNAAISELGDLHRQVVPQRFFPVDWGQDETDVGWERARRYFRLPPILRNRATIMTFWTSAAYTSMPQKPNSWSSIAHQSTSISIHSQLATPLCHPGPVQSAWDWRSITASRFPVTLIYQLAR